MYICVRPWRSMDGSDRQKNHVVTCRSGCAFEISSCLYLSEPNSYVNPDSDALKFLSLFSCTKNLSNPFFNIYMHKLFSMPGTSLGNLYCDPLMINGNSPKIAPRQRWTPTQLQLQILENVFQLGNGTPSKQRIKEMTSELRPHGQISETNVYNWFQNRRARSKRKQATATEAHDEGSKVIKRKSEQIGMSQSREGSSEVCESSVLNPGVNQLMRDHTEMAEGFQLANRYNFF